MSQDGQWLILAGWLIEMRATAILNGNDEPAWRAADRLSEKPRRALPDQDYPRGW